MKILKNLVIALLIIALIAGIGIYFLPKEYKVSNSIEINKPVNVVYAQLSNFNTWDKWNPWREEDTSSLISVEGAPGMKGHKMSWSGKKTGEGSITIYWCEANKSIHSDLVFVKPFKSYAKDIWTLEAEGDKTKATWTNTGGLSFPMGRLFGLSIDKMLSPNQVRGLDNLKKYCELLPAAPPMASSDSTGNE